jgi:hypothetical protein
LFETAQRKSQDLKEYGEGILLRLKKQGWKLMNSYTHTGLQQVLRRIKTDALEPNYRDDEIEELLNCTNALGFMAVLQIAILSTNQQLPMVILEKGKEFMDA